MGSRGEPSLRVSEHIDGMLRSQRCELALNRAARVASDNLNSSETEAGAKSLRAPHRLRHEALHVRRLRHHGAQRQLRLRHLRDQAGHIVDQKELFMPIPPGLQEDRRSASTRPPAPEQAALASEALEQPMMLAGTCADTDNGAVDGMDDDRGAQGGPG